MSVGEQIEHIAFNVEYMVEPIAMHVGIPRAADTTAAELLSRLAANAVRAGEVLSQLSPDQWQQATPYPAGFTMTPLRAALVLLEHDAHHRGQLIVALRLLGIDPPKRWKEE